MTRCLTDAELQAIVDGEATAEPVEHARRCLACAAKRDRLAARTDRLLAINDTLTLPDDRRESVRQALQSPTFAGSTTLRATPTRDTARVWAAAALATAATIAVVVFVRFAGTTTVSAAEVLDRSRAALVAPTGGVEVLTYELLLNGVLAQILPDEHSGRFTVEERIDHDQPGRYRIVKLADGRIVGGAADDPARRLRTRYVRAHGRGYLLQFTEVEASQWSILALKRFALEMLITLMQASGNQTLQQIERDGVALYQIQIGDSQRQEHAMWGLTSARALVTVEDARLIECVASGFIANEPFDFEFALRTREVLSSADADDFTIAPESGDVILEGQGTDNPMWDIVERALRALPAPPVR